MSNISLKTRKNWYQSTGSGSFPSSIHTPGQRPCIDSSGYNRCLQYCTDVSSKKGYPCNGKNNCCEKFCYGRKCKDPWKVSRQANQGGTVARNHTKVSSIQVVNNQPKKTG